jgi:hypothetical protein
MGRYTLDLSESSSNTHRAEDRPIYEAYLADVAVLFAMVIEGADRKEIQKRIEQHERLWGHTWLQDSVYKKPRESFDKIKELLKSEDT